MRGGVGLPGGERDHGDFQDGFVVAILSAAAFQIEGHERGAVVHSSVLLAMTLTGSVRIGGISRLYIASGW